MVVQNYTCRWCQEQFKKDVNKVFGSFGGKQSKHKGCFSDQVRCPKCARLIKTWHNEK